MSIRGSKYGINLRQFSEINNDRMSRSRKCGNGRKCPFLLRTEQAAND